MPLTTEDRTAAPRVWVLAGDRAGDRAQLLGLAEALGWPFEIKRLAHNPLHRLPNLALGASLASLDRREASPLASPWPDLVLASGRRSVPVARWIRARSGGRTRLVHIGRPWAPLRLFDLVITTPQYGLPDRPNVVRNTLSLNRVDPDRLAQAGASWRERLSHLPKPHVALLVGGNSRPYMLDVETARRLGREASAFAERRGGSLLVSTSRRTPPEAAEALFAAIGVPVHGYRWQDGGENPYPGYLALADFLVVTGDSASMLSEALATGKPVQLFDLPERPDWRLRALRRFQRLADRSRSTRFGNNLPARLYDRLVDLGLLTSTRDLRRLHEAVLRRGWATRLGEAVPSRRPAPSEDWDRAVQRVRDLFPEGGR